MHIQNVVDDHLAAYEKAGYTGNFQYVKLSLVDNECVGNINKLIPSRKFKGQLLQQMATVWVNFGYFVYGSLFHKSQTSRFIRCVLVEVTDSFLQSYLYAVIFPLRWKLPWMTTDEMPSTETIQAYVAHYNTKKKNEKSPATEQWLYNILSLNKMLKRHPVVSSNAKKVKLFDNILYNKTMGGEDAISATIGRVHQQNLNLLTTSHGRLFGEYMTLLMHQLFRLQQLKWCVADTLKNKLKSIGQFREHRKHRTNLNCNQSAGFQGFLLQNRLNYDEGKYILAFIQSPSTPPTTLTATSSTSTRDNPRRSSRHSTLVVTHFEDGYKATKLTPTIKKDLKMFDMENEEDMRKRREHIGNCTGLPGKFVKVTKTMDTEIEFSRIVSLECSWCQNKSGVMYCHGCHLRFCMDDRSIEKDRYLHDSKADSWTVHSCFQEAHMNNLVCKKDSLKFDHLLNSTI